MTDRYAEAGVDVSEADRGIARIVSNIRSTWPKEGIGTVKLDIGYFANVIDIGGGKGLATTTDGVGSKTIIAHTMQNYSTIGIDCVAMNVNDLICVGATPLSMLDYIGVEYADAHMLASISVGLAEGARRAGISISGGEISQLPGIVTGFDLVGAAFGLIDLDKINQGETVAPGDAIIGIASTGVHSNGLTLARDVLFEQNGFDPFKGLDELEDCIGNVLLTPTAIYVEEILDLVEIGFPLKAMINITGDGLLNLNRVKAEGVGFYIDNLPKIMPIFDIIQKHGQIDDPTMFQTFNMGVGFCVIVPHNVKQEAIDIIQSYDKEAFDLGVVVEDQYKNVHIPAYNLVGRGKSFRLVSP